MCFQHSLCFAEKVPLPLPLLGVPGLETWICPRAALEAGPCCDKEWLRAAQAGFSYICGPVAPGSLSSISLPSSAIPVQKQYPGESILELQGPAFSFNCKCILLFFFRKQQHSDNREDRVGGYVKPACKVQLNLWGKQMVKSQR